MNKKSKSPPPLAISWSGFLQAMAFLVTYCDWKYNKIEGQQHHLGEEDAMTRFAMFQFALVLAVSSSISCSTSNAAIVDVSVGPGGALVFGPADLMIDVGDTVRWTWDSGGHNVGSGLPGAPTPFFLSGPPEPAGTTFEFLFDQSFLDANPVTDNIYAYHCHPHGDVGMIGNITVIPEPGSAWLASLTAILFLRMRRQTHASKRSSERTLPIRCL